MVTQPSMRPSITRPVRCSRALRGGVMALVRAFGAQFVIGMVLNLFGLSFIDYGHDFSSAIMAGCWLVALGALVIGLVRSSPARDRVARGEL